MCFFNSELLSHCFSQRWHVHGQVLFSCESLNPVSNLLQNYNKCIFMIFHFFLSAHFLGHSFSHLFVSTEAKLGFVMPLFLLSFVFCCFSQIITVRLWSRPQSSLATFSKLFNVIVHITNFIGYWGCPRVVKFESVPQLPKE